MLRLAYGAGTRRVVATPHIFRPAFSTLGAEELRRRFEQLQDTLRQAQELPGEGFLGELRLELAAEHHLSPELFEAILDDAVLPYGESRRLLVELPIYLAPEGAEAGLEKIAKEGYQPLLAHVERYSLLLNRRRHLRRLLDMGCLLQINAESVLSGNARLRKVCSELLKRGWVHAIASDAHHEDRRRPLLDAVAAWLSQRFGVAKTRYWLRDGPTAILDGDPIATPASGFRDWWDAF